MTEGEGPRPVEGVEYLVGVVFTTQWFTSPPFKENWKCKKRILNSKGRED